MSRLAQLTGLLLWLTIAVTGCDSSNQTPTPETIFNVRIKQAQSYLKSGQIQAAQAEAKNLLIANPDSVAANAILIKAALLVGDHSTAQKHLSNIKPEINSSIEFAELDIQARLQRGEYSRVILSIDRHQTIWESQPALAALYKAQAFSNAGFFDEASQLLNQYDSDNQTTSLLAEKIKLALLKQDLESAEQMLVTLVELHNGEENAQQLFLSAELLMLKRQWKDAEKTFTAALSAVPNSDSVTREKAAIYQNLSDALVRTNRLSEVAIYDRVLNKAQPDRESFNRKLKNVLQLIEERKESEAVSILNEMVLETRKPENAYRLICQIYYQQSQISKAAKYCSNL